MRRVLDTSALLSGLQFSGSLLTVPEVLHEIRRQGMTPQLEAVLETQVRVRVPRPEVLARAREASEGTGDAHRLSPADLALVALALEEEAALVTDDYSIQNACRALGIPFEPVLERGIRDRWTWSYCCTGCRKVWPEWHEDCPICGARLRTGRPRVSRGTR